MNELEQYKSVRANLVKERIRLMDVLEAQMDFPRSADILAYEINKRAIIDLDLRHEAYVRNHPPPREVPTWRCVLHNLVYPKYEGCPKCKASLNGGKTTTEAAK